MPSLSAFPSCPCNARWRRPVAFCCLATWPLMGRERTVPVAAWLLPP